MIANKQMQYTTTPDNIQLYVTGWLVDEPRAAVLIVHGIGEHSGRYGHVISALNRRGYSVFTYDQRGHGKSGGQRVRFETPDALPDDVAVVRADIDADVNGLPLFIYGHSMGSLVALAHALEQPEGLAGLILTGAPFAFDSSLSPLLLATSKVANRLMPRVQALDLFNVKDLSRDPAVVKDYVDDPLNHHGRLSVRSGTSLLELLTRTRERLDELTMPLLVLHGEADAVCPPAGGQMIYDRAASADKTLTIYPELFHEIHNEPEQAVVISAMLNWLDAHTG
jgi:alpha-beta hydrolase superfamily lysophospholipase